MMNAPSKKSSKSTLDALPKPFVSAMRTLFDVMDDRRSGYVRLADIERRWPPTAAEGAVEALRKVTPPSGLLSFERFCAGLRICLLRSGGSGRPASVPLPERPPPSAPAARRTCTTPKPTVTATVRPTSHFNARAVSMPQLLLQQQQQTAPKQTAGPYTSMYPAKRGEPLDRSKVSMALEKWRMMRSYPKENQENVRPPSQPTPRHPPLRGSSSYPSLPSDQVSSSDVDSGVGIRPQDRGPAAKKASRRREPRRHTVSNGIDYNMIKRLKLLEQEKDFLLQGLDVVERSRKWYLQQITNVSDKLDRVSKWDIPHSEYSMDAQHERLNFQMTRITEVNQHLNALMETSEKGFPIHMNLAVHQRNLYDTRKTTSQTIQRLKDQNHALTEEIAKKSEMITQLETEKSALIRELFHARTFPKQEPNDTTLW